VAAGLQRKAPRFIGGLQCKARHAVEECIKDERLKKNNCNFINETRNDVCVANIALNSKKYYEKNNPSVIYWRRNLYIL